MENLKPITAEIRARGQLTIPKRIRGMGQMDKGQVVSLIPVGDSVIITQRELPLDEARREIKKYSVEQVLLLRMYWRDS
jgi:bifunctional DNA-binding transcriptional regulator/antitoxin component of YhaV-PrlF toxin-antitoxin module